MDKVTIADCAFLQYQKSESIGGDNSGIGPTYFEWELADPQEARFVTDGFLKHAKGNGQVAWLSESFFLHPENYTLVMGMDFDYVLTHNQYFVNNMDWLWQPHGGSWIAFDQWGMHEKTKNVSLILSEKKSMRGHRLRHEVVEKYGSKIDDVYGYDTCRVRKFDGLASYNYSVVIESERCPYFFSEKLIDCLSVGTVPIYWGCPDIGRFFDKAGIIQVDTLEQIGDVLTWLPAKRNEKAIRANIEIAKNYRISEDWIYKNYPFLFKGV